MQKLENAIEFYGAISHNKLHGLSVQVETNHVKLPAVVDGFASEGIIQFFFEDADNNDSGFNIYILDESNRAEVYHHCEGSKRSWCATSAASIRHRTIVLPTAPALSTSTCRSSIRLSRWMGAPGDPFRTQAIAAAIPTSRDVTASPVLQQRYS